MLIRYLLVVFSLMAVGVPAQAGAPHPKELQRSVHRVLLCMNKSKNCRFQILGIIGGVPTCQFNVMPGTWKKFSATDREAVVQLGKLFLEWVHDNPEQALTTPEYGVNARPEAPAFPWFVQNVQKMNSCKVCLSSGRDQLHLPGWIGKVLEKPVIVR